ncbi:hypothetical protein IW261DRAFT_1610077 [Armillaria novae-zelandiae]|uniref:Uncharacterized protein n=1 Tax=Armillaria novae-zelandiae TaxID=153914 RepID=A0AA39P1F8_9AGAR|nr:hypothetical protein IW261DRAFT_1610077 [Armillaria novae-zelandiae]
MSVQFTKSFPQGMGAAVSIVATVAAIPIIISAIRGSRVEENPMKSAIEERPRRKMRRWPTLSGALSKRNNRGKSMPKALRESKKPSREPPNTPSSLKDKDRK